MLVGYRRREVMVDCGLDWRDRLARLHPAAIVLTHAHPDHAAGLRDGAPCPVYAPAEVWSAIDFPRHLANTLLIAIVSTIGTVLSCTLVAYGFARFRFP